MAMANPEPGGPGAVKANDQVPMFKKRKKPMSNHENNRVLIRKGARELSMPEIEQVAGSFQVHTLICTAMNTTGHAPGDGDGCNADHDHQL
jgi:hypothetical protein